MNDLAKMGPAQLCTQCGHYLLIGINVEESHHAKKISRLKSTPIFGGQLCPQRGHYLFPVRSPLVIEEILSDAFSDLPIEKDESCVHRLSDLVACRFNKPADIVQEAPGRL